jgi:hypothetical protein
MKHSKCGLLLVMAAAGLAACGGDPTESFKETDQQIIADPGSLFLQQGANTFVTAEVHDAQGNQLPSDIEATNVGSGITVEKDTTFLETTNGSKLPNRERFIVTAVTPGIATFTLAAGSVTQDIAVRVVPTSVAATFSNPAPAVNEPITITAPAGYKFGPNAAVASVAGDGFITGFAADSTSVTAIIPPGSTGVLTLTGLTADFLPGVELTLDTDAEVAAGTTQLAGTDAPGTAPEIPVPALDGTINFFDTGAYTGADITGDGGLGAQYYKFVVTEAGNYHFVTNWTGGADLDAVVCFDAACSDGAFAGSGTTQPEDGTLTLDPGTYYYAVVLFGGAAPPFFSLTLTHEPLPSGT